MGRFDDVIDDYDVNLIIVDDLDEFRRLSGTDIRMGIRFDSPLDDPDNRCAAKGTHQLLQLFKIYFRLVMAGERRYEVNEDKSVWLLHGIIISGQIGKGILGRSAGNDGEMEMYPRGIAGHPHFADRPALCDLLPC